VICLDASVVVKLQLPEVRANAARALFMAERRAGESVLAPALLAYELTNVVRRQVVDRGLPPTEAALLLDVFLAMPITLTYFDDIHRRALVAAHRYGLAGTYDAHYVAVAEEFGCDLWTDDVSLFNVMRSSAPFVRWLGSYPAA
jgi:predicted nucleic acid-binding protein